MPSIDTALRNASILRWWGACSEGFKIAARALYARHLGCPVDDLLDLDTFAGDSDVLEWMAKTYQHTIAAFADDEL